MNIIKKFSVIIPFFNREKIISRAIDSVLNQTYQNFEILLVNDSSSDNYMCVLKKYQKDDRIKLINNDRKRGVSGGRNTGILYASGDYISFLDSDDEWHPYHLEFALKNLLKTKYKLYSCLWQEETLAGTLNFEKQPKNQPMFETINKNYIFDDKLKSWKFDEKFFSLVLIHGIYCFHINFMVVAREIFDDEAFLFNEDFKVSEDALFSYKLISKYKLITSNYNGGIYHLGNEDNLYSFFDRSNPNIDQLRKNPKLWKKLNENIKYKALFWKEVRNLIPKSENYFSIKKQIEKNIFYKYLSGSYINRGYERTFYLINSILYIRSLDDLKTLINFRAKDIKYFDID